MGDSLAFRGRLSRLGYWRWQIALVFLGAAFAYGAVAIGMAGGPRWLSAMAFAPMVPAVIAAFGVVARRLHDRGRGATWLLLFVLAPWSSAALSVWLSEGSAFRPYAWAEGASVGAALVALALNLWAFVEVGVLRGDPAPNRFGPPPE